MLRYMHGALSVELCSDRANFGQNFQSMKNVGNFSLSDVTIFGCNDIISTVPWISLQAEFTVCEKNISYALTLMFFVFFIKINVYKFISKTYFWFNSLHVLYTVNLSKSDGKLTLS